MSSKYARMPLNVVLDEGRGIRATASMSLKDGTPSPPYVVEWVSALQSDLLIVGTVKLDDKVRQRVDVMKKGFLRHFCNKANSLADQREFNVLASGSTGRSVTASPLQKRWRY